jgi:hypothetical protein
MPRKWTIRAKPQQLKGIRHNALLCNQGLWTLNPLMMMNKQRHIAHEAVQLTCNAKCQSHPHPHTSLDQGRSGSSRPKGGGGKNGRAVSGSRPSLALFSLNFWPMEYVFLPYGAGIWGFRVCLVWRFDIWGCFRDLAIGLWRSSQKKFGFLSCWCCLVAALGLFVTRSLFFNVDWSDCYD